MKSRKHKKISHLIFGIFDNGIFLPIIFVVLCLCFLLSVFPYFITKYISNTPSPSPEANFELVDTPNKINVFINESSETVSIDFEEYIKGVVACEMPSEFHEEALKAQSVAARTYSTARALDGNSSAHPDAPLCNSTHCQVYKSPEQLEDIKGKEWMDNGWQKICAAVEDTEGQLLYYNGQLVKQALFHSSSGGKTENSEDVFASSVPYLVSVDSPYEDDATHQNEKNSFTINEFSNAIKKNHPEISFGAINRSNIKILSRSNGDRVDKIQIGDSVLSGRDVREALQLPSAKFDISFDDDNIIFTSDGSGHGVGMSQYGADGMAKNEYDYKQILNHYYSGTEVY